MADGNAERPTVEGAYPLYLDGATCGCYGDVLIREQRGGIPWKPCALHAAARALLAALTALIALDDANEIVTHYSSDVRLVSAAFRAARAAIPRTTPPSVGRAGEDAAARDPQGASGPQG